MIREYRDEDAPTVVELTREIHPHWVRTVAGFRHRVASATPEARKRRWVAEVDGRAVGFAYAGFEMYAGRADVAFVDVGVAAPWRARGIGGALFEPALGHVREHGAGRVLGESQPDEASRRFAEHHRFRHTMTRRLSALDPRTVDPGELRRLASEKAKEGFRLVPFSELRAEDVFEADAAASRDIPLDEPLTNFRFEQWEADHWLDPDITLDGSYAVVVNGKPVSYAMIGADLESGRAAHDMTGTLREYRGRGLARLAKLAAIVWAAEQGITSIATENDATNAPMLALNVSLGYRPVASLLAWVRDL